MILTGEYPPRVGGVAGYTAAVANALATAGDEVHVWAPTPCHQSEKVQVQLHPLTDTFSLTSLKRISCFLSTLPSSHRVLVQYVPQAFGSKSMNLPFCLWIASRRQNSHTWIMFHEVTTPYPVLSVVNPIMARLLIFGAERVFVSIPYWERLLINLAGLEKSTTVLPVPSNISISADYNQAAEFRKRISIDSSTMVFGYFGGFPSNVQTNLIPVVLGLLARSSKSIVLMLGSGSSEFKTRLGQLRSEFADRIIALSELTADSAALYLAACDVLIYPFPDGVSGRRTSLMAGLALGLPIVTTEGRFTESLWRDSDAVVLVDPAASDSMISAAERLATDNARKSVLSNNAQRLYKSRFAIERVVEILRKP